MATVLNRGTKQILNSVNTLDYPVSEWIVNPDLSSVSGFDYIYWIIDGDTVSLMTQTQRLLVDQQIAAFEVEANKLLEKQKIDRRALVALAKVILSEINILRTREGLSERTNAQLRNAVLTEIDNG